MEAVLKPPFLRVLSSTVCKMPCCLSCLHLIFFGLEPSPCLVFFIGSSVTKCMLPYILAFWASIFYSVKVAVLRDIYVLLPSIFPNCLSILSSVWCMVPIFCGIFTVLVWMSPCLEELSSPTLNSKYSS